MGRFFTNNLMIHESNSIRFSRRWLLAASGMIITMLVGASAASETSASTSIRSKYKMGTREWRLQMRRNGPRDAKPDVPNQPLRRHHRSTKRYHATRQQRNY